MMKPSVLNRRGFDTQKQPARAYQPRKHSKTFTGCWTCRTRKVKCDETRPACRQCSEKNLTCEGYEVRLQWLTPETGDALSYGSQFPPNQPMCHRSKIALGSSLPALPFYEIDEIMSNLDSLRKPKGSSDSCERSRFVQCFGVFDPSTTQEDELPPVSRSSNASIASPPTPASSSDAATLQTVEPPDLYQSHTELDVVPLSQFIDEHVDVSEHIFPDLSFPFDIYQDGLPLSDFDLSTHFETELEKVREDNDNHDHEWNQPSTEPIPRSPSPNNLPSQERFLMNHYTTRVVHLFGVFHNPKSPWKTIHIPRALQSAGELVCQGSTSEIRNSLRNALLSISAFCLSNDHKVQLRPDEAQKWAAVATKLRGEAIRHLKEAVDSSKNTRLSYKEFLATMLSMVSINVMSGDTQGCGMHLDAAYRLILQAQSWKTKYSNKAIGLHRIYFYLRTIHQSTVVKSRDRDENAQVATTWNSPESDISGVAPSRDTSFVSLPSPLRDIQNTCTYENIYGIPYSLLVLLNKVVALVNEVICERERTGARLIPRSPLADRCDELEASIMDWETEPTSLSLTDSSKATGNSDIINQMTRAFHNGIIIYFAQHVRLLGHHYLRPFILQVIDSIEIIERIKAERKILAAPLFWPAFIAASEAFDPGLQERFRSWYNQVEIYGIEGIRTGIRVLADVWDQGPCTGSTNTSIWRIVVEKTGAELLLS